MYGWTYAEELRQKAFLDRRIQIYVEKTFPDEVWIQILEYLDSDVFCKICDMWVNGPQQWSDHKMSKRHKKNCQKQQAAIGCAVRLERKGPYEA